MRFGASESRSGIKNPFSSSTINLPLDIYLKKMHYKLQLTFFARIDWPKPKNVVFILDKRAV
jgi:hypothetical protein